MENSTDKTSYKIIIIIAALAQMIQQLIANMTVVALPQISVDLNFNIDMMMWVNLIYLCFLVAFCIPGAKIIAQRGVKKYTLFSLLALFISVIITIVAVDPYFFLASRAIQGISCAILSSSIYMMIVMGLDEEHVGSALGIVGSAGYIGMLIAPSFMGFMIHLVNWRAAFLIFIPIIISIFFLFRKVKTEWTTEKHSIDSGGSLIYMIFMVLFTYGITILDEFGIIPVIISLVLLLIFIKVERSVKHPIYNLSLLRDVKYTIGNYAAMVSYFTTTIATTALTFHLLYINDYSEYIVGLILLISPIIMVGLSGLAGRLSNRIDPRIVSGIAMIFIFISMLIFGFLDRLPERIVYYACILQGIGAGLFSAPNNKYVLTLVDVEHLPDASSFLSTSKEFGKILSMGIYTLIFSINIPEGMLGHESVDSALLLSTNQMMIINAVLALSAIILLFYSYSKYELNYNIEVIELFKSITPEWIKKRF